MLLAATALTIGAFVYLSSSPATLVSSFEARTGMVSPLSASQHPGFSSYKLRFGKSYGTHADESYRHGVYARNMAYIAQQNARGNSHTLGETAFTDMTWEEFKEKYLMHKPIAAPKQSTSVFADTGVTKPKPGDHKDWTKEGVVSRVKDQGQCGSCWAFSTIGALESAYAIASKKKEITEFSEQELVDCCGDYGNQGCDGGWPVWAFDYIKDHKISLETEYKYTAMDGTCKGDHYKNKHAIKSYVKVDANVDNLIAALKVNPVSVIFEVQDDFMHYTGGIYKPEGECGASLNHAVLAVGFEVHDKAKDNFFYVKNSWGTEWGDKGFFEILMGTDNGTCGIAGIHSSYPVVA